MLSYVEEVCLARLAAQQVFQKNATEESMYIHGIIKVMLGGKNSMLEVNPWPPPPIQSIS